jgi:hypothetical protein
MLADFVAGKLDSSRQERVETHLAECDACLEEYASAKFVIAEQAGSDLAAGAAELIKAAMEKIREKIGRFREWMSDLQPPEWMLQYGLSPVRSGRKKSSVGSVFVRRDMKDLNTEIFLSKSEENRISMWIKVFKEEQTVRNVMLILIRDNGIPMARYMRQDHEFFDKLQYGSYNLILEQNATPKGRYNFKIDERGFYESEHHLS